MEGPLVATARFVAVDLLHLNEKLKAITGTERKMEELKESSAIIDKAIQHIESRSYIDDTVKDLLKKLKYLAYDLEDVVDYYDTKVFQKKQRSKNFLSPVRDFFSSDNQVLFKSTVGDMIKAITESLDSILLQKSILSNLLLEQGSIPTSEPSMYNRETHSRNRFNVIGREAEKNKIVDMLTKDDEDENNRGTMKVIAIVGMGGLGKTTLAQLVYNDARVKDHFASLTMWKVVGAEFDPAKIMKSILELATRKPVDISEIDLVMQELEATLSGKKFLLVLDDVWTDNPFEWGQLTVALTGGARGSKILVTTRSQKVSLMMGSLNTTHQIQQLSGDDCLSLFQQYAFGDQAVDQNLMNIGNEIIKKCGGVPLAAISLGNMLRSCRDETYWSSVLKSEIWQLEDQEDKVLAILKLSYNALDSQSKKCFAFASVFPKNYWMAKDELIKLWIANGFVRSKGDFDAETNGNQVFNDLVMGSFFLLAPSSDFEYDSHVIECTMHDLMHDLARSVSADMYWINSDQDSVEVIGKRTYHLQIDQRKFPNMTQAVLDKKPLCLRTFMPRYTFQRLSINLLQVFSELKFLRVLDLTDGGIREVPTSIENLIHLRYLNLSKNEIDVLPDSITLLSNLQYLNLSFNRALQELPKELGNMQNLRDLNLFESDSRLTHMPCGLSRLINLRSLPLFIADEKIGTCSILELEDLKLHGKMKIKFSKDFQNYSCGGREILKNKDLNELWLEFNGSERYDKDMLDYLCPKTSLKKLTIFNYWSSQFPTWLMESQLPYLVEVSLVKCHGCKHIPQFGNLQFLKKLHLQSMDGITHMGAEFHGYRGFPSLQELLLHGMDNLEEWSESSDGVVQLFPLLQKLQISNCPNLKCMPWHPRIKELELLCCSDSILSMFPLLQKLQISNCPNLKCMPWHPRIKELELLCCSDSILSCIGRLTSLSVLRLRQIDMTSLPSGCIRNLTSLTELQIIKCRQLQSLPVDEIQHLEMLQSLTIDCCDNLASFPWSKVGHLSSLRYLRLSDCLNIMISQPEELVQIFDSVHAFEIHICGEKVDLRGQLQLHKLVLYLRGSHDDARVLQTTDPTNRKLEICCCDELMESLMTVEAASTSLLETLYIDGIFNLTTLPDWLQHLNYLRCLVIKDCLLLERMPTGLKNLHELEYLYIVNCPQLASRCEKEIGEDWPIISHVSKVYIEGSTNAIRYDWEG